MAGGCAALAAAAATAASAAAPGAARPAATRRWPPRARRRAAAAVPAAAAPARAAAAAAGGRPRRSDAAAAGCGAQRRVGCGADEGRRRGRGSGLAIERDGRGSVACASAPGGFGHAQHVAAAAATPVREAVGRPGFGSTIELEEKRRARISEANKGRTPWNKGRKMDDATKERIRAATIKAMSSKEVRTRLSESASKQRHTTQAKERISRGVRSMHRMKKVAASRDQAFAPRAGAGAAGTLSFAGGVGVATFGSHAAEQCDHIGRMRSHRGRRWGRMRPGFEHLMSEKERERHHKRGGGGRGTRRATQQGGRAPAAGAGRRGRSEGTGKGSAGSEAARRAAKSEEHRKKIGEAIRRKWQNPSYRDSVKAGMRKTLDSYEEQGRRREVSPAAKARLMQDKKGRAGAAINAQSGTPTAVAARVDEHLGEGAAQHLDADQQKDALEARARDLLARAEAALEAQLAAGDTQEAAALRVAVEAARAQLDDIAGSSD